MKLRLEKNSIRLRLRKSDIEKLQHKHAVGETVLFPNGHFAFDLCLSSDTDEVSALIGERSMAVTLPFAQAEKWMHSDEVGIYHDAQFISDHALRIIIEKDFPCKEDDQEDKSDTFTELASQKQANHC